MRRLWAELALEWRDPEARRHWRMFAYGVCAGAGIVVGVWQPW